MIEPDPILDSGKPRGLHNPSTTRNQKLQWYRANRHLPTNQLVALALQEGVWFAASSKRDIERVLYICSCIPDHVTFIKPRATWGWLHVNFPAKPNATLTDSEA